MTSATQGFRYLTPEQVQTLVEEDWHCYVCHDGATNKPIVSHCGTLHAAHWECEIVWLKEHGKCGFCFASVSWEEIKDQAESWVYQKTLSAVSALCSWSEQIATAIYPTLSACASLAQTCIISASRHFYAWANDIYSKQYDAIEAQPILEKLDQGPMRIYLSRPDHYSITDEREKGPIRINVKKIPSELLARAKIRNT